MKSRSKINKKSDQHFDWNFNQFFIDFLSIWGQLGLQVGGPREALGGPSPHPCRSCLALGAKMAPRPTQEGLQDRFLKPTWPQYPLQGGFRKQLLDEISLIWKLFWLIIQQPSALRHRAFLANKLTTKKTILVDFLLLCWSAGFLGC